MKKRLQLKFAGIVILALVCFLIAYPRAVQKATPLYNQINKLKIKLGLDLQGGIHLEYRADISNIDPSKISEALQGAQEVIERRVNAFGVGEPLVQTAKSGEEYRVIVELPGIKNIEEAKQKIKDAPLLEFKEEGSVDPEIAKMFDQLNEQTKEKAKGIIEQIKNGGDFTQLAKDNTEDQSSKDEGGDLGFIKKGLLPENVDKVIFDGKLKPGETNKDLIETENGWFIVKLIEIKGEGEDLEAHVAAIVFGKKDPSQYDQFKYKSTGLTGKNLKSATAQYTNGQGLGEPEIALQFDDEGTKILAEVTKKNLNKPMAIFLDGELQIAPIVRAELIDGRASITGNYTFKEAKDIADRLNQGALPVPLTLVGQQSVEATLGADSLRSILIAGAIGLGAVVIFMLLFYRFLGLVASLALLIYTVLMITIFKMTGITLTLSGIAGFVLSIGMAVDANILIFERTKEEIRSGRTIANSLDEGFKRAWTSIRDGNVSSLLTAGILYLMGTGFVKGFAASLFIGVVVSMFTAVVITRTMLKFIISDWIHGRTWLVGVKKSDVSD